jgi:hypothetical protein
MPLAEWEKRQQRIRQRIMNKCCDNCGSKPIKLLYTKEKKNIYVITAVAMKI